MSANSDISVRKQKAEELRTDPSYARSLIEASLDPLVTIGPDGKITDVNEASIKVIGVPREQLIGSDFSTYFTEPHKAREGYRQVFDKGFVTDYPLTIRHKGGKLTDVLYNASVYKDTRGNVLGVFAAARDVTESKRVMREFAQTKTFLDNILQSSIKYSIIGQDLNHRILSWNEGARRNYGYTAEEVLGKDSSILHTPKDIKSGMVEKMQATAHETGLAEGEFQRVRKDGSCFTANVVVTLRNDASGRPIGYLLMSNDISEKKRAEEQLHSASQYARSLIEASLDPLVTISPDGKITDVNKATEEVTGVSRESLIGSDFSDYFTDPAKARGGYQQVLRQGFVKDYPLTIRHTSGRTTDVMYNATVYRNAAGEVEGVFAAARDITDRKRAEEALRESEELFSKVFHASHTAIAIAKLEGPIVDVNERLLSLTGFSKEEMIGHSSFELGIISADGRERLIQQLRKEDSIRDMELEIRDKYGNTHVILLSMQLIELRGEKRALTMFHDITERKRAEEALARQAAQEALARQAQEILEISLPVVQLWEGVVLVPLIGTLDSQRTQQLMERLLPRIVETNSSVALLDITGVPGIDTQTARHLVETISAVRLLGAQVVLTGVRPAIAQTLVHLGIDVSGMTTRSSLTAGLRLALEALNLQVVSKNES